MKRQLWLIKKMARIRLRNQCVTQTLTVSGGCHKDGMSDRTLDRISDEMCPIGSQIGSELRSDGISDRISDEMCSIGSQIRLHFGSDLRPDLG